MWSSIIVHFSCHCVYVESLLLHIVLCRNKTRKLKLMPIMAFHELRHYTSLAGHDLLLFFSLFIPTFRLGHVSPTAPQPTPTPGPRLSPTCITYGQ